MGYFVSCDTTAQLFYLQTVVVGNGDGLDLVCSIEGFYTVAQFTGRVEAEFYGFYRSQSAVDLETVQEGMLLGSQNHTAIEDSLHAILKVHENRGEQIDPLGGEAADALYADGLLT